MAELPPIPTPTIERWRAMRLRTLPLFIFAGTMLLIVHLWRETVMPPTFTGAEAGTLTELGVSRFQVVSKGTPIAIIEPIDERVLGYELRLQRLRLPWLAQKVALATSESNLQFAEIELGRAQALLKKKVISPQEFDLFQKKKEALETDVAEKKSLVADIERRVGKLQPSEETVETLSSASRLADDQEMKMRPPEAGVGRKVLTAPIDGMISMIFHRPGESVTAGEPIAIIAASSTTHVIGYMREPIGKQPDVGMDVRIRSRDPQRSLAYGKVTRVGVQFEPITPTLQNPIMKSTIPEIGLPVEVTLPPGLQLRPGSIVDLTLMPKTLPTVASRQL
jgi:multidrug resistance efflux pump